MHTCIRAYIHTYMHTRIHTYIHAIVYPSIRLSVYLHTSHLTLTLAVAAPLWQEVHQLLEASHFAWGSFVSRLEAWCHSRALSAKSMEGLLEGLLCELPTRCTSGQTSFVLATKAAHEHWVADTQKLHSDNDRRRSVARGFIVDGGEDGPSCEELSQETTDPELQAKVIRKKQ